MSARVATASRTLISLVDALPGELGDGNAITATVANVEPGAHGDEAHLAFLAVECDEARLTRSLLYRKGAGMEAKLCFIGHALMENRHGLLIDTRLTRVSGHAERLAALDMIASRADRPQAITLGGDKGFDAADFVMELREINVTPHIARNTSRRSAIDVRTTRHPGYAISQRIRKRIEEGFGWMKTVAGLRKTKYRGLDKVGWTFTFAAAAYNLIRLPKLMTEPG